MIRHPVPFLLAALACGAAAADLRFGDPASVPPPPAGSVGFPDRSPDLDALPGFRTPPPGYGIVPFYWWLGDPLTRERLAWQLDRMAGMGVSGYQINYAHSDRGGRSYGLTYPSEPAIFSTAWWELTASQTSPCSSSTDRGGTPCPSVGAAPKRGSCASRSATPSGDIPSR